MNFIQNCSQIVSVFFTSFFATFMGVFNFSGGGWTPQGVDVSILDFYSEQPNQ